MHVLDTGGTECYRALNPSYYRNTHCALLVYDTCSLASFRLLECTGEANVSAIVCAFIVVGTKADLEGEVGWSEAQTWARGRNALLLIVSAKTGQGVEEAFIEAKLAIASPKPTNPLGKFNIKGGKFSLLGFLALLSSK